MPKTVKWRITLMLTLALAPSARAQTPQAELPRQLVTALLSGSERLTTMPPVEYFVGTVPAGFPAALVPSAPAVALGAVRSGGHIIVIFSDTTRRLPAILEQQFEEAGYKRPAPTPGSGFSGASGPYRFFCRDSASVSVEPLVGPERHMARVSYRVTRGRMCADFVRPPSRTGTLRLPALKPPTNAHVASSGGGAGDEVTARAVVTGEALSAPAVLAHYASQLIDAGWKTGAPAVGARVATQFFEAVDDAGGQWQGTLLVSGFDDKLHLSIVMRPR